MRGLLLVPMISSFRPNLYLQLSPDCLTVRDARSGQSISEVPELAVQRGAAPKVLAVGSQARLHAGDPETFVINPFAHPRSLVSDFEAGEQLLKAFIARIQRKGLFRLSPVVVVHPLGHPEGGFTSVEIRALREMAFGAGASFVVMWSGRNLSDQELLSFRSLAVGRGAQGSDAFRQNNVESGGSSP